MERVAQDLVLALAAPQRVRGRAQTGGLLRGVSGVLVSRRGRANVEAPSFDPTILLEERAPEFTDLDLNEYS